MSFDPGIYVREQQEWDRQQMANGQAGAVEEEIKPYPFVWLKDIKPNLANNELIKGLLPRGGLGEIHAAPSAGKTAIITDMLIHLAAGREYRGRRVTQAPVLYVALEGHAGMDNRVVAARTELGIEDAPFVLIKITESFREPGTAMRIAATARLVGPKPVIAIDTLTAALGAGASDCKPEDVSLLLENLKPLLADGSTIIVLHHFGKDHLRGARGWSGLNAALDFEWELVEADDGLRTMKITKYRDGSTDQPAMCFRLEGIEVGVDQHGEQVTSVVVDHQDDADGAARGKARKLSKAALAVKKALWDMIKDSSRSFPLPGHPGLRCVLRADLEAECVKPGVVSNCKNAPERRRAVKGGIDALAEAGDVTAEPEGRIYPAIREDA